MLARIGEAGADACTIMRIARHSSVTVSQLYVHPTPESLERAFERLESLNIEKAAAVKGEEKAAVGPLDLPQFPPRQKQPVPENLRKF
jgi:hypothetical protein